MKSGGLVVVDSADCVASLLLNRELLVSTWALPILDELRGGGVSIGVVSDCSAETPDAWAMALHGLWDFSVFVLSTSGGANPLAILSFVSALVSVVFGFLATKDAGDPKPVSPQPRS